MNTLEQLGVISALNDSYRESHGLASSNALDSAFDELENALDDALADSSSSVSMAEPESETVSVAESTVYDEPEEYTQNQTESDSTGYEIHQNSLAEDIYISIGDYTSGNMTEEQKAELRSYGENAFYSAWQDAMYSDLIGQFRLILRFDIRTDKFFGIVIKVAHLYGFQGSWNVIPRMLAKIIDGIPI